MPGDFFSALTGDWGPANIISPQPLRQGAGQLLSGIQSAAHNLVTGQPAFGPLTPAQQQMANVYSGASTIDQIKQGASNIANAQSPLDIAGGAKDIATAPFFQFFKATNDIPVGSAVGGFQRLTGNSDPNLTPESAFEGLPLAAQMASYIVNPAGQLGTLAKTPKVITEAGVPAVKMVEQGGLSKVLGLATENPLSQIETAYAKYNPLNLAFTGAGNVLDRMFQMTPMGKGLKVADLQNSVVKAFGQLLRNAGVDMNPDEFYGQLRLVQSKDSDVQQAAALRVNDAEEKITQYLRGETPGVEPVPLPSSPVSGAAQDVTNAIQNGSQPSLPPPTQVAHVTFDEWAQTVKKALRDNGDQTSYIVTSSGQRYAVSPISPGSTLRQRIFRGQEVRTQSGETVPISEVVQIQNPQGEEVASFPKYAALIHPPAVNNPDAVSAAMADLPSKRDQDLLDQAHASDWIKDVVKGIQAQPLTDNLRQRLSGLGIDPDQLTNALRVRAGVQGKVAQIQNAQVQALDNISTQFPNLIANDAKDVLKNKALETLQSATEPFNQLRNAVNQGKSYLEGGDMTNLDESGLGAAVDKGFNDVYQKSFQSLQNPSQLSRWAQRTVTPITGALINGGLAMQAGADPLGIGLAGGLALLQATPAGRALGMAIKQTKRAMPGWTAMMQSDEGMRSLLNGVSPLLTPKTILSKATQWGDVTPEAEDILANMGQNANFNPYSKDMEDALGALQFGPLTQEGQVQSEAALGQRGLGKLGEYINNLSGGRLGGVGDYLSTKETALNRMMGNQDMLMRTSAAIQGKEEVMNKVAPYFAQSIRDLAPQSAQEIESSGGAVSQKKLADLLTQDGIQGDARENIINGWQNVLDQGTERGIDLANKIHYNYRYGSGVDQFMNQFLLNHTWATRNLRYYPQMLAEHPWTIPMIGDFLDSLDEKRQHAQGTLRFLGMLPGDSPLEKTLGMLGAQEGQGFTDPTQGVSIASQLLPLWKMATHPRPGEEFGNDILDSMGGLSMGMQPLSQMGLQGAGAVGERSYSPIFSALNAPINLAQAHGLVPIGNQPTNIDPFSAVANKLHEITQGYQPNTTSRAIQREVENLLIEKGLGPNTPEGKMAANNEGPLWQEAARRVAGQKGEQELGRFLGTPNVEFESPGEQTTQRLAGDPLWQPNLNDPIEQALFAPWTLGHNNLKKSLQGWLDLQKEAYNRERLNNAVGSNAATELLARAANSNNGTLQKLLQEKGLSVTGGNNPTVLDGSGQPISPDLARSILVESKQTAPEFSQAGQAVREAAAVNPLIRRPMVNAPDAATMEIIRAWDSGDPALRAKILADPQSRAIIAAHKGVNP